MNRIFSIIKEQKIKIKESSMIISSSLKISKGISIISLVSLSLIFMLSIFISLLSGHSYNDYIYIHSAFASSSERLLVPDDLNINSGSPPNSDIFNLPPGYIIKPIAWNLNLPTSVTFDDEGNMYIAESGYIYGEYKPTPRILKADKDGNSTT